VFLRTLDTSLFTKRNLKGGLAALFASLLAVCSTTAVGRESPLEASGVRSDFLCTHDVYPFPQNADAQRLFDYARHLDYLLEGRDFDSESVDEFNRISRYYRIASAYGNAKATEALHALQWRLTDTTYDGVVTQLRRNREEETTRLRELLTQQSPSRGYRLQAGMFRQAWNLREAFVLFRKAADMGDAESQFLLAEYLDVDSKGASHGAKAKDKAFALPLYRCAAQQGHGGAMYELAIKLIDERRYAEAIAGFQQAVMEGDAAAAFELREAFGEGSNSTRSLGVAKDAARYERYEKIRSFLIQEGQFAPRVPDLDRIVPLPPAALPEWNGEFLWKNEQLEPREAPSETLVARMAKAKALDSRTGLAKDAAQ
jgi:TPR repeat protein